MIDILFSAIKTLNEPHISFLSVFWQTTIIQIGGAAVKVIIVTVNDTQLYGAENSSRESFLLDT